MPKKRVHELAKELGLESKVLIARLEKIGISVKSASSSLDEDEVERAKKELTAGELREVVEQRIKTTVIRRRTVVTAVEKPPEEVPVEEAKPTEEEAEGVLKKAPATKAEKIKKEKPSEKAAEKPAKISKGEPEKPVEEPHVAAKEKISKVETSNEERIVEVSRLLDGYKEFLDRLKSHNVEALKQWEIENFEEKLQQIIENVDVPRDECVAGKNNRRKIDNGDYQQ